MNAGWGTRRGLGRLGIGTLAAALSVIAAMLPASTGATLIEPHGSTHSVNTHAASPPASPSSAPVPTLPAPQASSQTVPPSLPAPPSQPSSPSRGHAPDSDSPQESDFPGASIPAGESDPPFPEGLPIHSDPDCDLDCKQAWYEWFSNRVITVSQGDGSQSNGLGDAARALSRETRKIEAEIEKEGATPGRPEPDDLDPTYTAPAAAPPLKISPTEMVIDAITGVGPLATNDLGTIDLTGMAEVADLVSLSGPIRALAQLAGVGDAAAVQVADLGSLAAADEEEGDLGAFLISFAAKVKAVETELALQSVLNNIPFVGDAHACPKGSYQSLNDQKDDPHAATFACY